MRWAMAVALLALGAGTARADVSYPGPAKLGGYQVLVDDKPIELETLFQGSGFGYRKIPVTCGQALVDGACEVNVRVEEAVSTPEIYPMTGVSAVTMKGKSLNFQVAAVPAYLAIHVNAAEWLFLFLDRPDPDRPDPSAANVLVLDRGIDGTGGKLETANLQKAIDAAAARGVPTTVFVPKGIYRTGSLWIKSNVTLYLDAGAVLRGDLDEASYPKRIYSPQPQWNPATDPGTFASLIWFEGVHDAAMRGRGMIDGQGSLRRDHTRSTDEKPRPKTNMVRMVDSERVQVEGVTLRDSEFWTLVFLRSRQCGAADLKVVDEGVYAGWDRTLAKSIWNNTDGIDVDSCSEVTVDHAFVYSGDDSLVIKTTNSGPNAPQPCENVIFRHCVIANTAKIGTESIAPAIRHILFQDIDDLPMNPNANMVITPRDCAVVEDVTFRDFRIFNRREWLRSSIGDRMIPGQKEFAQIRDVLFENIEMPAGLVGSLLGHAGAAPISNVRFEQVKVGGKVATSLEELHVKTAFTTGIEMEAGAH